MTISHSAAAHALALGIDEVGDGSPCSISILDAGRNLVAFIRMEGAILASIEVSHGKAYTAGSMGMPSGDLAPLIQPGQPFYGFETSHRQPMVIFAGGFPVHRDGRLIGAVGVAGGDPDADVRVAQTVVRALEAAAVQGGGHT